MRKRIGTIIKLPNNQFRLLVKGASELMLESCDKF